MKDSTSCICMKQESKSTVFQMQVTLEQGSSAPVLEGMQTVGPIAV